MDLLPLISASMGAMGSLTRKLEGHLDSKHKGEIGKLTTRMRKLSQARDPPVTATYWMMDVRELSYDMDNCIDAEVDWTKKLPGFMARVKEANGRYERYVPESFLIPIDIVPIVDHRNPTVGGCRKSDPVVGLHEEGGAVDEISQLLANDGKSELKVVSIVGACGIGKSTLAKQLWRDPKFGGFDCRAFVRTAKKPDMRNILRSILEQVRPDQPPNANEVHELIDDLTKHLQNKRYFLIIDDLWATSVWHVARRAFPKGNGSRIITITEIEDVALACCSYQSEYIFKMKPLSNSHSKELFTSAVFGSRKENSRQLDEVLDEIIRRCAGLPQAIISISGVLEANTLQNREKIKNTLPENATSDEILNQVLIFCYNCLPSCLQTCLLFLTLYPENYIILKEDIMKQWEAAGFICAPTENGEMKVAESYFDKLVDMGMIQQIDVNYSDEVLYYVVQHTTHDIIGTKSIEENFVSVIDYSQRTVRYSNKVSHLSLQFGSATYATAPSSIGLSQLRALAYTGLSSCLPPDTISEFKLLRVLILHIWDDQPSTIVDLSGISELLLLRYLQVRCNGTVNLPAQLQGLEHLETLEINARVAAIPSDIVHLWRLLHLRLGEEYDSAKKLHSVREKDASSQAKSEQPEILKQKSEQNAGSDPQFIQMRSNIMEVANVVEGVSKNRELASGARGKVNMITDVEEKRELRVSANCFGEVVDDDKLNKMEKYMNKPKSRQDRARVAWNQIKKDDKDANATRYVEGLKSMYGNGQSTLCLVYNATGDTLRKVDNHDWYGYIGSSPYPAEIGNGQWAAFHHVHRAGEPSGSVGAVVYRGKNGEGEHRDYLLAWSTPWGIWYRNKAYCEIGVVDCFKNLWAGMYDRVANSDYSSSARSDGCEIDARIETGDSPKFTAKITVR